MEHRKTSEALLELITRPAFCVQEGCITEVNQAARQLMLLPGAMIEPFISEQKDSYATFSGGSLSLNIIINDTPYKAQVIKTIDSDLFVLDTDNTELRAVALAAQHLRNPLNSVMTIADQISGQQAHSSEQAAHLQRGLHRLHRIICNMSDSYRYQQKSNTHLELTNITSVFDESMESIESHLSNFNIRVNYTGLQKQITGLVDREMLERAIYNLVSNGVKFMAEGSALEARLSQNGNMLSFTVQNENQASMPQNQPFNRYLREPGVEDSRNGIGLGMALVRAVAASHGGTILVDHPNADSTRITMTIRLTDSKDTVVRSTIRLPISNYAGDRNRGLLELSDVLPADAYKNPD